LNKEFLKGIQARERVVALNKIIKNDSIIIHNYKDSIVPNLQVALDTTEVELVMYYKMYDDSQQQLCFYRKAFWGTAILSLLLIIFN
jgi:hypothetical protein